eukprot:scaffold15.g4349.t1
MAATLVLRPGDPQALKAAAAAGLAGTKLALLPHSDPSWQKLLAELAAPLGGGALLLVQPGGAALTEPNAMARWCASSAAALSSLDLSGESWLEWEERVLRPAALSGDQQRLGAAVGALAAALARRPSLSGQGGQPGLADLVVYATLSPLSGSAAVAAVQAWMDSVAAQPAVAAASQQVLLGAGPEAPAAVFAADVAASAAAAPRLPVPGQRNVLITSALPYVNNVPHLGNIIGCVLSADVYARYCRARGYNAVFVCGTDEYGTATETKALEEGLSCQEICDKYHAIHKARGAFLLPPATAAIYEWFDIGFDKFGRTPTRAQTEIGQDIFRQLQARGMLVEQTMEQLYSEPLGKFLADRFVIGTCPKCKYEDARGDQCDACGSLLNPTELINPKCKLTGSTPVVRQTKHIFLDLPRLSNSLQLTKAWMEQGLKVRCITRDLKWGTPVPLEGYEDKVFYVWFDAPIGYISITAGYCGGDWKAWWHNPKARDWTMMKSISVTEYLNYEDGKFSKSRGVGVFGNDAKDTGIPVEVWRYYLLAVRPESSDAAFQWDDFAAKNNAELNDNLGNFLNRTLKFIWSRFDRAVPGPQGGAGAEAVRSLGERVARLVEQYLAGELFFLSAPPMEGIRMKEALKIALLVSKAGNGFFQARFGRALGFRETEIWVAYKQDRAAACAYISACAGVAALLAALLAPFMPSFSAKLCAQLGLAAPPALGEGLAAAAASLAALLPMGHRIGEAEPTPLFRKISDDEVAQFRERFAGSQADRAAAAAAGGGDGAAEAPAAARGGGKAAAGRGKAAGGKGKALPPTDGKQQQQQEKQQAAPKAGGGGGKGAAANGAAAKAEERPADLSRVDLRVGLIRKAWRHPDAESLYVEEVDVGEPEPRTVVSGLVKHIPEAEMQQRHVVLVCNLKPANMRGVKSQAMVLAATSADGTVELVEPPADAAVGERVSADGFFEGAPDEQLNPKRKVWEAVQPELATDGERHACYRGAPLRTAGGGACTVRSVVGGSIRKLHNKIPGAGRCINMCQNNPDGGAPAMLTALCEQAERLRGSIVEQEAALGSAVRGVLVLGQSDTPAALAALAKFRQAAERLHRLEAEARPAAPATLEGLLLRQAAEQARGEVRLWAAAVAQQRQEDQAPRAAGMSPMLEQVQSIQRGIQLQKALLQQAEATIQLQLQAAPSPGQASGDALAAAGAAGQGGGGSEWQAAAVSERLLPVAGPLTSPPPLSAASSSSSPPPQQQQPQQLGVLAGGAALAPVARAAVGLPAPASQLQRDQDVEEEEDRPQRDQRAAPELLGLLANGLLQRRLQQRAQRAPPGTSQPPSHQRYQPQQQQQQPGATAGPPAPDPQAGARLLAMLGGGQQQQQQMRQLQPEQLPGMQLLVSLQRPPPIGNMPSTAAVGMAGSSLPQQEQQHEPQQQDWQQEQEDDQELLQQLRQMGIGNAADRSSPEPPRAAPNGSAAAEEQAVAAAGGGPSGGHAAAARKALPPASPLREEEEEGCCVCLEEVALTAVCVPCAHVVLCAGCARALHLQCKHRDCPLCRTPLEALLLPDEVLSFAD